MQAAAVDEAAVKAAMTAGGSAEQASAEQVALRLARLKAGWVRAPETVVIGADQLLVCEGRWFDKPVSVAAARQQLEALRGRTHELVTAVVCWRDGVEVWQHVARPRLVMRAFSEAFLTAYLALEGERVMESVGGYRLEGPGMQLFARVDGEFSAVLGLPLLPLLGFLRGFGVLLE